MAMTPEADEIKTVASHGLAYLRTLDKKVDLVIESLQRQGERLARVERDLGETRRDLVEVKGDIALLENKVVTAQTEILTVLRRLDEGPRGAEPQD
jgi:predicted  nucleic acid-binding Zn-ribbon protein